MFTAHADPSNNPFFNGMDFLSVNNYSWNPSIDKIDVDLRDFQRKRRWCTLVDLKKTREAVVMELSVESDS
jgi:hypothetical protein